MNMPAISTMQHSSENSILFGNLGSQVKPLCGGKWHVHMYKSIQNGIAYHINNLFYCTVCNENENSNNLKDMPIKRNLEMRKYSYKLHVINFQC